MKLKARAVIWHGDQVVVCRERRRGKVRISLPGGRVNPREGTLDALVREVKEETGRDVRVGPLLYVAEVVNAHSVHDLNLIFDAELTAALPGRELDLVDLDSPEALRVVPPILGVIARDRRAAWPPTPRWLGNLWRSESTSP